MKLNRNDWLRKILKLNAVILINQNEKLNRSKLGEGALSLFVVGGFLHRPQLNEAGCTCAAFRNRQLPTFMGSIFTSFPYLRKFALNGRNFCYSMSYDKGTPRDLYI